MARTEQDREDLLREATALVERAELQVSGWAEKIVVGFRRGGQASFFFGAQPVYQFNAEFQLRRGYCNGQLITAEDGSLVALTRRRQGGQLQLVRRQFDGQASASYVAQCGSDLRRLRQQLNGGQFTLVGQVPDDVDILGRIGRWLAELPETISIADRPNVGS